jgi:hypothetical protein
MACRKIWAWGVATGAAMALGLAAGPVLANHSWGGYHWANVSKDAPLKVKIYSNISSTWTNSLNLAFGEWNDFNVIKNIDPNHDWSAVSDVLDPVYAVSTTDPKKCSPISGHIQVCSAAYGLRGWLGIAQIWLDGTHITAGITKLNDSYFGAGSAYNTPAWRDLVTCQEVGHDFGLAHQNEDFYNVNLGSCMDYTNDPDGSINGQKSNVAPNYHDYEQLTAIYNGHTEPTSGGGGGGRGKPFGEGPGGDSPAEWGKAIHYNVDGKPDYFLQTLPSGRKKLTHVFWTPERAREHHH